MQFINPGWNVFHVLNTETFSFRIFILATSRYIETLIFLVHSEIYSDVCHVWRRNYSHVKHRTITLFQGNDRLLPLKSELENLERWFRFERGDKTGKIKYKHLSFHRSSSIFPDLNYPAIEHRHQIRFPRSHFFPRPVSLSLRRVVLGEDYLDAKKGRYD